MIKKTFILLILSCLLLPLMVFGGSGEGITLKNILKFDTFEELVDSIIALLFYVGIILAPVFILLGAFYFLTSGGNPNKVQTGQRIILYTVIGLAVIMLSRALMSLIEMTVGA